jgi:hypothetical protein
MNYKSSLIVAVAAIGISLAPGVGLGVAVAQGNCMPGDRVDGSTANQAAARMRAAGYNNLTGFHKGCDSYWHATGTKDGQQVGVVLSPQGVVMTESAMDGSADPATITNTITPMGPANPAPMNGPPPGYSPGPQQPGYTPSPQQPMGASPRG